MSHFRALLCSTAAALALALVGPFFLGAAPAFADGPHMSASTARPQHMSPSPQHMQMHRSNHEMRDRDMHMKQMHKDGDHDRDDRRMRMNHDRDDRHMQMKHLRPDHDHDRDDRSRPHNMHPSHPSMHGTPHNPGHSSMMGHRQR